MMGDVVGWWCWASPSGGLTDLTGNWDVFLIDCDRLGIKGQDGEVTFRGTLLSTGTYDYLAFLSPKTCRHNHCF